MEAIKILTGSKLYFGEKSLRSIGEILNHLKKKAVLLVIGRHSFRDSSYWDELDAIFKEQRIKVETVNITGEPDPEMIDEIVEVRKGRKPGMVIAIGGGSVIDAGKAVSAMFEQTGPSADYLEGVGTQSPSSAKIPFTAVPTTSGTGSEVTKNAVLSRVGTDGYKKSLRNDAYIPDYAVIDPRLILSCPRNVTIASGLDAVVQLLEAFISVKSNPFTDTAAKSGLEAAGRFFVRAVELGRKDLDSRAGMAYSAYQSGIALTNAGLGPIHGMAGILGGWYPIPHGTACGLLAAPMFEKMVDKIMEGENHDLLSKFSTAGILLGKRDFHSIYDNSQLLIKTFHQWKRVYQLPGLGQFGVSREDFSKIADASGLKNSPVSISREDFLEVLEECF